MAERGSSRVLSAELHVEHEQTAFIRSLGRSCDHHREQVDAVLVATDPHLGIKLIIIFMTRGIIINIPLLTFYQIFLCNFSVELVR